MKPNRFYLIRKKELSMINLGMQASMAADLKGLEILKHLVGLVIFLTPFSEAQTVNGTLLKKDLTCSIK